MKKLYAGIVMKIVVSMVGFQGNNVIGVAVVKKLSLKAILIMPVTMV